MDYDDAAYICEKCGRGAIADEYRTRSAEVAKVINTLCYDFQKGMYKDGSVTQTFSMHTTVWAILLGIASGDKAKELVATLDTEGINKCTFAMNYYLLRALEKRRKQIPYLNSISGKNSKETYYAGRHSSDF